tara:strand:- start:811 stop:1020 length:210 start_codon:yes stop_codon:yes gene_type:complete
MFSPFMKNILFFLGITIVISIATLAIGKFLAIPIFFYIHYILWLLALFVFFVLLGDFKINKFLANTKDN